MMDAREWLRRNADRGSLDAGTNAAWGLGNHLLRGRLGDRFAVAASASQQIETQINALADVLAWTHWTDAAGSPVSVVVGHSAKQNVVVEALQTLRHALIGRRDVEILVQRPTSDSFVVNDQIPYDFADHPKASEYAGYMESWRLAEPSGLAVELLEALGDDRVRLYPQLSKSATVNPHWSVRLDGLQVGIVGATTGWLDVGKTSAAGNNSLARSKWLTSGAPSDQIDLALSRESMERGVGQIRAFAKALEVRATPGLASALLDHGQPEHALEAAILRGAVPVEVRDSTLRVPHPHRLIVRDKPGPYEVGTGSDIGAVH